MAAQPPLILTLELSEPAFTFFNNLRQKHFPPAINYLQAHLTLFHHLPHIPEVTKILPTVAASQPVISLEVANPMKLGKGVAYAIKSEELVRLHRYLQKQWQAWLTPQDRQGFRPHITVQNKVLPAAANALYTELTSEFVPFAAEGIGLSLWAYQGGPWHKFKDFYFTGSAAG